MPDIPPLQYPLNPKAFFSYNIDSSNKTNIPNYLHLIQKAETLLHRAESLVNDDLYAQINQIFQSLDNKSNGKLGHTELVNIIKELDSLENLINKFDIDKNKLISDYEYSKIKLAQLGFETLAEQPLMSFSPDQIKLVEDHPNIGQNTFFMIENMLAELSTNCEIDINNTPNAYQNLLDLVEIIGSIENSEETTSKNSPYKGLYQFSDVRFRQAATKLKKIYDPAYGTKTFDPKKTNIPHWLLSAKNANKLSADQQTSILLANLFKPEAIINPKEEKTRLEVRSRLIEIIKSKTINKNHVKEIWKKGHHGSSPVSSSVLKKIDDLVSDLYSNKENKPT